jgi:hypothetical protein
MHFQMHFTWDYLFFSLYNLNIITLLFFEKYIYPLYTALILTPRNIFIYF